MNRNGLLLVVSAAAAGLAFAGDVLAQQETTSDQLQEVVVTAEKRTSTVQTTPISITALTGKDIEERGIYDLTQIVDSVPGVSMRNSGPGQTELEMRGMTSAGGNSSVVGFYLDDVPLSAPASAQNGKVVIDPDLYDLNRIEVLRGPQGTLYGSGSMGGTIKLVPNDPNLQSFDASGQVVLGHTIDGGGFNSGENAMVNFPLANDVAALRIVGSQSNISGWINRVVVAAPDWPLQPNTPTGRGPVGSLPVANAYTNVNNEDLTSFRVSLLVKPMERLSIEPMFMYQKITQDGLSQIDSVPGTNNQYQPYNDAEPFEDRIDIGSLNVQYHFDFADLTSVSSYWTRDEDLRQDGTEEIATVLSGASGNCLGATPGVPCSVYPSTSPPLGVGPTFPTTLEDDKSWQSSEEVRLTSAGDTQFKWLVGYFFQNFESDWDLYVPTPDAAPLVGVTNGFTQIQPTKITQNAFFGEASYKLTPDLTATAGLRRFSYHGAVYTAVSGWLSSAVAPDYLPVGYISSERNQGVTPKFNLSYDVNKDLLVYGQAAKGFRPGGGNQPIPTTGSLGDQCLANLQAIGVNAAPLGYGPDTVWSYELGEKFRSADGHLTLNSAGYFEHWANIQQDVPLACGFPFTGNLGSAHIYGGEVELDALLAPGLLFMVNTGWAHARFVNNPVAQQTTIDDRVQSVPDWMGAASLAYRTPITTRLNFVARVDYSYVGSRIDVTAQPNYLPSYDLANIRAGVDGGNWNAMLFVNNVGDKTAQYSNTPAINVNVATFNRTAISQPLTFGIDMSYRWK
jgi:outer membrane receptor protein involved in Fe transport